MKTKFVVCCRHWFIAAVLVSGQVVSADSTRCADCHSSRGSGLALTQVASLQLGRGWQDSRTRDKKMFQCQTCPLTSVTLVISR
jgi:hypothetical protein